MDTYEERSVELKTSLYDIEQQMKELSTKIDEVCSCTSTPQSLLEGNNKYACRVKG